MYLFLNVYTQLDGGAKKQAVESVLFDVRSSIIWSAQGLSGIGDKQFNICGLPGFLPFINSSNVFIRLSLCDFPFIVVKFISV